jgi:predicted O-methyltransferase YrrM
MIRLLKPGGWLAANLEAGFAPPALPVHEKIEQRATMTQAAGNRPLWEGYRAIENYPRPTHGTRTSNQVRTAQRVGRFYSWLAAARRNPTIIEIGTAFGVSGMFWLAGIGEGHLFTFEPNQDWAALARDNLAAISSNFTLTVDTFESAGPLVVPTGAADIAFIDAIHTGDFVRAQLRILLPLMKPGGLILLDDIGFSPDMARCWQEISADASLVAAAEIGSRVGITELA